MPLEPHIKEMLSQEVQPPNIVQLKNDLLRWLRGSRSVMKRKYSIWDRNARIYRGYRRKDEEDLEAKEMGEPEKMVVPLTYTQIQTFVAFTFLLYLQNDRFFELTPTGDQDFDLEEAIEKTLQRDLNHNDWYSVLYQSILDIGRFGVCILKSYWKLEKQSVRLPVAASNSGGLFPTIQAASLSAQQVTKYEGNAIVNISPYRFFPDMRLPLSRWKEGQFAFDEMEFHISHFWQAEDQGEMAGTHLITQMEKSMFENSYRWEESYFQITAAWDNSNQTSTWNDFMAISTEGICKIKPKDYGLGPEDFEVPFLVTMVNDQRITSIQRFEALHGEFIHDVAQFSPDNHNKLNEALADNIHALQDIVTWLINSRILSVRRGLDTHMILDPSVVDMATVEARSPFILLRKGAPRTGVQNFIQQLKITDVTQSHFTDADVLMKIMQQVTGVSDNALGQVAPGRRSATENRAANAGAASRMKIISSLMFSQAYQPLGKKMMINQRQWMSYDTFRKICGRGSLNEQVIQQQYAQFHPASPLDLIGNEDFFVWDATLQSEKGFMAQSLQELLQTILGNPVTMQVMMQQGFNISKCFDEIQFLRGINNVSRFFTPGTPSVPGQAPAPGVVPIPQPGQNPTQGAPAGPGAIPGQQAVQAMAQ